MTQRGNAIFFYLLYGASLYAGFTLLKPFWGAILCALSLGIVFYPMHRWIKKRLGARWGVTAPLLTDLTVLLFFVVPAGLIIWAVLAEADKALPLVQDWLKHFTGWVRSNPLNSPWVNHLPEFVRHQLDVSSEVVQERAGNMANRSVQLLATYGTSLAGNTLGFIVDLFIFVLVLFFVFRDGESLSAYVLDLMPLDPASKKQIADKLRITVIGVIRGTILTAIVQGICAAVGFLIVQTQGAILLGVLTALATLIPSIGTALVWIPVALVYFVTGHVGKGMFVIAWGILVVGVIDNLARPFIVGSDADIPFLWLFLGMLGGLEIFGPLGLLIGPILIVMVPVLSDIYLRRYKPEPTSPH